MRSFSPYEIVASVVRRSHDYVMCGQFFERVFENRTGQMGAVAVEGNNTSLVISCEVRKYRSKPCSKALTFLRNYACIVACELRQFVHIRLRAHNGKFYIAQ